MGYQHRVHGILFLLFIIFGIYFNFYFRVFLITFRIFNFYFHKLLGDSLNFYFNQFLYIFECGFSNFNLLNFKFLLHLISYLIFDLEISIVTMSIFIYFYNFSLIFLLIFRFLIFLMLIFSEEIISSKLN